MIWYEVVEDCCDGYPTVRRFKTEEEADSYCNDGAYCCYNGWSQVDSESKWFFTDVEGDE